MEMMREDRPSGLIVTALQPMVKNMRYTLWSRGRLLGETDLAWRRWDPLVRSGDITPTELGERILPIASEPSAAMLEWGRAQRRDESMSGFVGPFSHPTSLDATHHADVLAAYAKAEALNFELRRPDGSRVPVEDIFVRDTQVMLAWAELADEEQAGSWLDELDAEPDPELETAIEHDLAIFEEWEEEWDKEEAGRYTEFDEQLELPRFQIHVQLVDPEAIP
jgi:hypothetical protein